MLGHCYYIKMCFTKENSFTYGELHKQRWNFDYLFGKPWGHFAIRSTSQQ